MNEWVQMVREFHCKFGQPVAERPGLISGTRARLRDSLIDEEAEEISDAICATLYDQPNHREAEKIAAIADGLADEIFVCIGTALEYGIDLDRVFAEVHRTNMLKTGGGTSDAGKILKPPGWQPPRIREIIEEDMKR